jgi:hypothetical protein
LICPSEAVAGTVILNVWFSSEVVEAKNSLASILLFLFQSIQTAALEEVLRFTFKL